MNFSTWIYFLPLIGALTGIIISWVLITIYLKRISRNAKGYLINMISQLPGEISIEKKITEKVKDPAVFQNVLPVIETHMDEFLRTKLSKELPMISMFIGDKTIISLKKTFMREIEEMLPKITEQLAKDISRNFNPGSLISELPVDNLVKKPIAAISNKGVAAGALIGFIIGAIHLLISLLTN